MAISRRSKASSGKLSSTPIAPRSFRSTFDSASGARNARSIGPPRTQVSAGQRRGAARPEPRPDRPEHDERRHRGNYEKKLEIVGVGYLGAIQGKPSCKIRESALPTRSPQGRFPQGLTVTCPDQTHVIIKGIDKQLVGQFAAEVRAIRKPEPYKGKGIRYDGEVVRPQGRQGHDEVRTNARRPISRPRADRAVRCIKSQPISRDFAAHESRKNQSCLQRQRRRINIASATASRRQQHSAPG